MHTSPGSPANPDRKPSPFSSPGAWGRSFVLFLLKKDFGLLCVPPHHCNLVQSRLRWPKPQPGPCARPKQTPQNNSPVAGPEEAQAHRTPLGRPRSKVPWAQRGLCKLSDRCCERHQDGAQGWTPCAGFYPIPPPTCGFLPPGDGTPLSTSIPHVPLPPTTGRVLSRWGEGG